MENTWVLPDEYRVIRTVDLQRDRKTAVWVNLFSLLLLAGMIVPVLFAVPFDLFRLEDGRTIVYFARLLVLIAALVAYLVLHELVHGVLIWFFSGRMSLRKLSFCISNRLTVERVESYSGMVAFNILLEL